MAAISPWQGQIGPVADRGTCRVAMQRWSNRTGGDAVGPAPCSEGPRHGGPDGDHKSHPSHVLLETKAILINTVQQNEFEFKV